MQTEKASKPTARPRRGLRRAAGTALLVFIALMAALTLANRTLNEIAVAQVSVVTPQRGALEKRVNASGQLGAAEVWPVYAGASLHVERVYARAGQTVAAGDPLFAFEAGELEEFLLDERKAMEEAGRKLQEAGRAFAYAKADMAANALERYGIAQARVDRALSAYDSAAEQGAPQAALDSRLNELESAIRERDRISGVRDYFEKEKALEKAEQDYREALLAYGKAERVAQNAVVTAPYDAQVISVDIQPGSMPSAAAVMTLARLDGELELVVVVGEEEAEDLETGDMARITIGSHEYQYPILSLAPSPQHAGKTEIGFRLPASAGRSGMSASVEIRKRTRSYDLLLPLGALRKDSYGYYVFVVTRREGALGAETTVTRMDVALVEQDSARAAVQGGVSPRDSIVARGDRELHDGDRVRVKED